jgi:hypothetical protein
MSANTNSNIIALPIIFNDKGYNSRKTFNELNAAKKISSLNKQRIYTRAQGLHEILENKDVDAVLISFACLQSV